MIRPSTAFLTATLAASLPLMAAEQTATTTTSMPEVTSTSSLGGNLVEEQPVDPTGRPEWTSHRRFPTTRVYIQQAPWEVGFEQWLRYRDFRDGTSAARFQEEVEIGLPYRFQLDLYESWVVNEHRHASQDECSIELRYALADWNKIPLNPTLYFEYARVNDDADTVEVKLLLGQDLTPRLHYGFNFAFEQEVTAAHSSAYTLSQGLSYTLIDDLLSAGVEMEYEIETEHGNRHSPTQQFLIGPSVQIRPTRNTHLDLVGLIGTNGAAPNVEGYIVFGIDFGKVGSGESHYSPVSVRSN